MGLVPCDRSPQTVPQQECAPFLAEHFVLIKRLGFKAALYDTEEGTYEGVNGVVLQLADGDHMKAAKLVVETEDNLQELRVACLLKKLHDETPIFSYVYGYLRCSIESIPRSWGPYMKPLPREFEEAARSVEDNSLFMLFMDYAPANFMDINIDLTMEDFKSLVYLLVHGLETAYERIGFIHGDIHEDQILMAPRNAEKALVVGEKKLHVRFVPKLIDYGYSSEEGTRREHNGDMGTLVYMCRKRLYVMRSKGNATVEDVAEFKRHEKSMGARSSYFNSLEDIQPPQENMKRCVLCASHLLSCGARCTTILKSRARVWNKK